MPFGFGRGLHYRDALPPKRYSASVSSTGGGMAVKELETKLEILMIRTEHIEHQLNSIIERLANLEKRSSE